MVDAIDEYNLPMPDFAIGDVGTTIYRIQNRVWEPWEAWEREIDADWNGMTSQELAELLPRVPGLERQEPEKQGRHKLSFYAPEDAEPEGMLAPIRETLKGHAVRASLIWSIDEAAGRGLLDVLPENATKLHAVEFLIHEQGFDRWRCVFAGDSGNDLTVLTSSIQAVLVRNAREDVKRQAEREAEASGFDDKLYIAQGRFLGMNGHYTAGVLEGLAHYLPETRAWMEE